MARDQDLDYDLHADQLREITDRMIEALTSPPFVAAMRAVRSAPPDRRLAQGSRLLNPEALREAGVPLPEDMRISSRYFEEGLPGGVEFGDGPNGAPNQVNELNRRAPGLLDDLRLSGNEVDRTAFENLVGSETFRMPAGGLFAGGCCCGGAASACGGCGG